MNFPRFMEEKGEIMNFRKFEKQAKAKPDEQMTPMGVAAEETPVPTPAPPKFDMPPINVSVDTSGIGDAIAKGFKDFAKMTAPKETQAPEAPIIIPPEAATPPKETPKSKGILDEYCDVMGNW